MARNPGQQEPVDEPDDDAPADDDGPPQDPPGPRPADRASGGSAPGVVQEGAGWVLGMLLWAWVALPFIQGGPEQVKNVWRAKFLNQAPDGSQLP